jgi:hypothetical protein
MKKRPSIISYKLSAGSAISLFALLTISYLPSAGAQAIASEQTATRPSTRGKPRMTEPLEK